MKYAWNSCITVINLTALRQQDSVSATIADPHLHNGYELDRLAAIHDNERMLECCDVITDLAAEFRRRRRSKK